MLSLLAASVKTRPVFWHFVPWLRVVWYVLAVGSVFVFLYGVARPLVKHRRGHGGPWPPVRGASFPAGSRAGWGCCCRSARSAVAAASPGSPTARSSTAGWCCSRGRSCSGSRPTSPSRVRLALLPRRLLPHLQGDAERLRDGADRRRDRDDGPSLAASGQARLRPPRPGSRRSAVRPAHVPDRRLGVRRHAARDRADRVRPGGRADRDVDARLRRHPVRRLDHRPGADRRLGAGAGRRPPRAVVVPRPAGDHVRRLDPVHEGVAHDRELPEPVAARPAGGQAPDADPARPRLGARGLRDARGLQPAASAAARRLHEVRKVPRGVPGERDRPSAVAARRRARTARAVQPRVCLGRDRRRARGAGRRPRRRRRLSGVGDRRRTASAPRPSGRACSATRASRSARSGSSRRRSSTSCAGGWSRRASSTPTCSRRCRRSTSPATRSARTSAAAGAGPRSSTSRSPTRASSPSTCSGSSATTRRSIRARSRSHRRWRGCCTRPGSTSGSSTTASATPATTSAGSGRRGCSRRSPSRTSRRWPAASSTGS